MHCLRLEAVEETTSRDLENLDRTDHIMFRTLIVLIYRLRDFSAAGPVDFLVDKADIEKDAQD